MEDGYWVPKHVTGVDVTPGKDPKNFLDTAVREIMVEIAGMRMSGTLRPFVEGERIGTIPIANRADLSPRAKAAAMVAWAVATGTRLSRWPG